MSFIREVDKKLSQSHYNHNKRGIYKIFEVVTSLDTTIKETLFL